MKQLAFANRTRYVESWYIAFPSKELKDNAAKSTWIAGKRLVIYRSNNQLRVMDARCPHVGADLGLGKVVDGCIQCPFHHWKVCPSGTARRPNGKKTSHSLQTYPVQELHGYIWVYTGKKPEFEIPKPPENETWSLLKTPIQHIKCHPHIVTANALDITHFGHLHGVPFELCGQIRRTGIQVTAPLIGEPQTAWQKFLIGIRGKKKIRVDASTFGGHMAWLDVFEPIRCFVLFSAKPTKEGDTHTNVFFLARNPFQLVREVLMVQFLLHDDQKVLNTIQFQPGFVEEDEALKEYFKSVNEQKTYYQ